MSDHKPIKKSVSLTKAEIAASLIEHGVQVRIAQKVAALLVTESIKNVVIKEAENE